VSQLPAITSTCARFKSIRWLILIIALCAPALFADLGKRGPEQWMEGIALLSSRETWIRQHSGDSQAWLIPTVRQTPRLRKPPLLVWLNMAAWSDLDPATANSQQLVARARAVTGLLSVILILSIYWIARSLQDEVFGLFAAVIASTMLLLFHQGRLATYDMQITAWAALASAAGLCAIRPFDDRPATGARKIRSALCWILAGVATGAAILTKSPLCVAMAVLPIGVTIAFDRQRIVSRLGGLLVMTVVAAAASAWWFVLASRLHPELASVISYEMQLMTPQPRSATFYFSQLWWLAFPWTIWLIIGVIHPFTKSAKGVGPHRARRMIIWIWFVGMMLALSLPAQKERRYLVFALPAMALLIGQVLRDQADAEESLMDDPKTRLVTDVHWGFMIIIGACMGSMLLGHEIWARKDWLRGPMLEPWSWAAALAVSILLVCMAMWGWRAHKQSNLPKAMLSMMLFGAMASFCYVKAYADARDSMQIISNAATQVRAEIGHAPLLVLRQSDRKALSYEFIFYLGRCTDLVGLNRAIGESARNQIYLCAEQDESDSAALRNGGFEPVFTFHDLPNREQILWRGPPPR
jgi:4-amino-4-deoxy-L-arabinose transferase-like glycosyltransferase